MTVLVADDSELNRKLLNAIFSHEGFRVLEAADGVEALQVLEREEVDAVVSDILMPNMDGYRLCTEVRSSERFSSVPFIFHTSAYTSPSDEKIALELGADKFIRKPAPGPTIVNAVRDLVSGPRHTHPAVTWRGHLDQTTEYTQRLIAKLEEKNEELHRRTQELREISDKLQAVIRAAPVAIITFDREQKVTAWNPAAERIFGWSETEALGGHPPYLGAEDQNDFQGLHQRVLTGETITGLERHRHRRDGTRVNVELNCAPLHDADGSIVGNMAVLADVTDRKKAEEAVARSRDFYKSLFNDFPTPIWQSGTDARCIYFNRTWLEFTGRTLEQELGDGWAQGVHPDDAVRVIADNRDAFDHRRSFELEYRLRRHDGEYRDIVDYRRPFHELDGEFAGYIGSCHDITERKRAKARLTKSEALLAEAQALAHIGSWDWDAEADILIWSDELYRMMDLRPQERPVSYSYFLSCVHPEDRERVDQVVQQAWRDHQPFESEYRVTLPGRITRIHHMNGVVITDNQDRPARMHGTAQDITAQSMAEEALRQSEERFRQLAENIHEVFWIKNVDPWRLEFVSAAYEKIWKRSLQNLLRDPETWTEVIHPEDREYVTREEERLRAKGEYDLSYRIVWPDGSIRWIRDRAFPVRDTQGNLIRIAGIAEDITESKQAEQQLEHFAELLQALSHRLFKVQEEERRHLARELHDEIGQTLTAAKLNLKIIAPDVPPAAAGRLKDSVQIIDRLLQQVRQLSLDLRPPLLDELGLVPALRWLADQQAQRAGLRVSFTSNAETVQIDSAIPIACFRLAQEAITNAIRHARAESVGVELRQELDRLWLSVHDDGVGFDPPTIQLRATHGASLGLLSMKERALLAGGDLEVVSAPGCGTQIRAWFPLAHNAKPYEYRSGRAGR
jgi:PAS domain S-box-containing protein